MTNTLLFKNAVVIDGTQAEARPGHYVLVEGNTIREVSAAPIASPSAAVIDLKGRTLMPGLIDCHVHVVATMANLARNAAMPTSFQALKSVAVMDGMLKRGFTSVRDASGADYGLKLAVEEGLFRAPRLFIAGKSLSQTGGHGDLRGRFDDRDFCLCHARLGLLSRVADGVDAVRKAVREELKAGADFIKIMASGGVASPTDPIDWLGYSRDGVRAIVEETDKSKTYVAAHAYTAEAIGRAVELGVRTIEHGNLVDAPTAALMAKKGAYVVPTLVTYDALANEGASLGLPPESVAKIENVRGAGLRSLEIFRQAGVKMAFGTDLLGEMHRHQSTEFAIRARVLPAHEIIASATTIAAELLRMEGKLGVVAPDALADLLVVDGNPLTDISVLTGQGERIAAILKDGVFVKNTLA
ncbi:MAG: amidohydrolase family protein [Alphaproteobacteria bacterium]|nr:amidohydrolase family protein [Alphaproteobacteria bacterium]